MLNAGNDYKRGDVVNINGTDYTIYGAVKDAYGNNIYLFYDSGNYLHYIDKNGYLKQAVLENTLNGIPQQFQAKVDDLSNLSQGGSELILNGVKFSNGNAIAQQFNYQSPNGTGTGQNGQNGIQGNTITGNDNLLTNLDDRREGAMYNVKIKAPNSPEYVEFLKRQSITIDQNGDYWDKSGIKIDYKDLPEMPALVTFDSNGNPNYVSALKDKQGVPIDINDIPDVTVEDVDAYRSKAQGYNRLSGTGTEPVAIVGYSSANLKDGDIVVDANGTEYTVKMVNGQPTFIDANGNDVTSTLDLNTLGIKVSGFETNQTARINGVGSQDRDDIHDDFMHHTHITQTVNPYAPGQTVSLETDQHLDTILQKSGNILDPSGTKSKANFSKFDYIATYAGTGQFSVKDLNLTAEALAAAGVTFAAHSDKYFYGTELETIYNNNKGVNYTAEAAALKDQVEQLKQEFLKFHDNCETWSGSANDTAREAIQCILGKFEVTMGNIEKALEPSCTKMDEFIPVLEDLKAQEDILIIYKNELKITKNDLDLLRMKLNSLGACPDQATDPNGYNAWMQADGNVKDYENRVATKEQAIEDQKLLMDDILLKALECYFQISNYQQAVTTFSQFFIDGTDQNKWISSADNLVRFHDSILTAFEDYVKMPVITNLSDYHDGDVIDVKIHQGAAFHFRIEHIQNSSVFKGVIAA